ncbi:putative leucine--tRNA ligase, partial [Blattella germanica]
NEDISTSIKHDIESRWKHKLHAPKSEIENEKKKFYVLSMFPYPSGKLHMGHVIHPMGWDAFGLPAENAAIERGVQPASWTKENIEHMKDQLTKLGCSFDWDREIATCDPEYYRWTQFLFLKMYEEGLVYRKEALVNWDPVDQTVLADEQVDANGCSWRSGAKVEKKLLKQWFIRTTRFAKSLWDGLDDPTLKDWKDIINLQKHWIGECDGVKFEFKLENDTTQTISVFTRNPEYLSSASFIAVKRGSILDQVYREHGYSQVPLENFRKIPLRACNPITGEFLPIYVTDEVEYAEGADCHLGIPEISEIDRQFAAIANIPISSSPEEDGKEVTTLEDLSVTQQCGFGGYPCSSKLKDWLISRQRYWGTPIPIVFCKNCGPQAVPYSDLPVILPAISKLSNRGKSPLLETKEWLNTKCPKIINKQTKITIIDYLHFTVLHLYYARFFNHFLHSIGLVSHREPFQQLLVQGMVMGKSYRIKGTGQYLPKEQVDLSGPKPVEKGTGKLVVAAWEKMSKSKYNGVDPEMMLKDYGTDTTRLLILADHRLWLTMRSFLNIRNKLESSVPESVVESPAFKKHEAYMFDSRNYYLKGVTFNYTSAFQLSVAISKMQGLTNSLRKAPQEVIGRGLEFERALACQIIMLAPMAPHFASELWSGFVSAPHRLNAASKEIMWDSDVLEQSWPEVDLNYNLELVCVINGMQKKSIRLPRQQLDNLTHDDALELALSESDLQKFMSGWKIVNTAYKLHPSFEAVISITTEKINKEKQQQIQDA